MADGTIKFDTELNPDGLVSGLDSLSDESKSAMSGLSRTVNSEMGDMLSKIAREASEKSKAIASDALAAQALYENESERLHDSKKNAEELYLEKLKDNVERIKTFRDEELKSLKTSYELGLISTQDYFSQLTDWRDRYFEYGSVGWQSYTAEILKYNKSLSDEQQKALSDAAKTVSNNIKKQYDELLKEQESLKEKLSDFGGISRKNTIVGDDTKIEFTSLADMNSEIETLEEYGRLISEVKAKIDDFWRTDTQDEATNERNAALRSGYFEQLRGMSVEDAQDFANALLGASDSKLNEYLSGYAKKQELAEQISKNLFSDEVQDAADSAARNLGNEFTNALEEELDSLSGKFFSGGEEACKSFGEGFLANLETVLSELSAQISAGAAGLLSAGSLQASGTNVENNTSYNIYGTSSPAETIRLLREREEMKQLMMEG